MSLLELILSCDLLDSLLLIRIGRPVRRCNTELLGVLLIQSLPAELHRRGANDAAHGSSAQKVIQYIETNMPSSSAHCDEAMTDVSPQRHARAVTEGFEFPPHIEVTPVVFKRVGSVGSRHSFLGNTRCWRCHRCELHRGSNRAQVRIGVKRSPLPQMRRVGKRLPDFLRRVPQFSHENERPLLFSILPPVLLNPRSAGRTRHVLRQI